MFCQLSLFPRFEVPLVKKELVKPLFSDFSSIPPVVREPFVPDVLPYQVSQKLIISGSHIESYEYEKPYWVGYPRLRSSFSQFKRPVAPQESLRDDNVRRTRIKIRRLVNSNNDLEKFALLTFDEKRFSSPSDIVNLEQTNILFNQFIKRLTRYTRSVYGISFKYLAVPEFQGDYYFRTGIKKEFGGAVHYHFLCNLPYISQSSLEKIWTHGIAKIRKIDNIDNVGAYICKYLGKQNFDTRYFRKRKFFYSFNLLKPLVVDKLCDVIEILENLPLKTPIFVKQVFSFSFFTKYLGVIKYNQYKLSEFLKVAWQP